MAEDGAALSERVARAVMGWRREPVEWAYTGCADLWHDERGTPLVPCESWRPDADDRQAMQVLERMRELGHAYVMGSAGERDFAEFVAPDGTRHRAEADGPRLALIGAALAALDG